MIDIKGKSVPHSYRNKYLKNSGGNVSVIGGSSNSGANGRATINIITENDNTTFTDSNVLSSLRSLFEIRRRILVQGDYDTDTTDDNFFSSLRTIDEIDAAIIEALRFVSENYLSKVNEDEAKEVITLLKGFIVGNGVASIDADGNTTTINLMVQTLATIYNLDVASVATIFRTIVKDYISSETFIPGISGEGFKIYQTLSGDWNLEIDNATIRKSMTIFELLISKIRAVNGGLVISPGNGRIKSVSKTNGNPAYYVLGIEGDMIFVTGDLIRCQVYASGSTRNYWVEVKQVNGDSILCLVSDFGSSVPAVGDDLVQFGNTTNADRQGILYLTASEDGKPRIQVLGGVNSTNLTEKNKAILGCLDGITDTDFPSEYQPSGYGLYSENAFLKGLFLLRSGKTVEQDAQDKANSAQSAAINAAAADATSKANVAKAAADAAQTAANAAQTAANGANSLLADIANDNKLTPTEKQETKKEWDIIQGEYSKNTAQATTFGVSATAYTTVYNALNTYITPLLSSLTTTSDIVGTTFRSTFKAYYDARTDLLNAISAKAKTLADTAQSAANNAQGTASAAQTAANAAKQDAALVRSELQSSVSVLSGQITLAVTETKTFTTEAVSNLKIGARNYLRDSRLNYLTGWDTPGEGTKKLVTDSKFGTVVEWTRVTGSGNFQKSFAISDKTALANTDIVFFAIAKPIDAQRFLFGGWTETHDKLNSGTANKIDLGDGWYMYWITFKSGATIASGTFGFNSILGTWQFYAAGVLKGNKPVDWSPAPEDLTAEAQTLATAAKDAAIVDAAVKYTTKSELSTSITQLSSSISLKASQTDVSALSSRVSSAEAKITPDAINLTVKSQTENIVNAVQIGGRNLLRNSGSWRGAGWNNGFTSNGGGYTIDANEKFNGMTTVVTLVGTGLMHASWLKLENNVEYTYSGIVKCNETIEGGPAVPLHFWVGKDNQNQGKISVVKHDTSVVAGVWKRIYIVFKLTSDADSFMPFFYRGTNGTTRYWIAYLKLEKGNRPTDWLPSPEDVAQGGMDDVSSSFTITQNKITIGTRSLELTGAVTFNSLATDAQSKITTAQSTADTAKTNAASAASAAGAAQTTANSAVGAVNTLSANALQNKGTIPVADWNSITTMGIYNVNGGAATQQGNFPAGAYSYGQLRVEALGNIVTQTYTTHNGTAMYIRSKYNASDWQAWRRIEDAATSQARAEGARDNVALRLGYANYADMEAKAVAGQTIINGGYIRTSLIKAEEIITSQLLANKISATDITTGRITIANGAKIGNFSVGGNALVCDTTSSGLARNVFISDYNIMIRLQKSGYSGERSVMLNPQSAYQSASGHFSSTIAETQSIALSVEARNGTVDNVAIAMQGGYITGFCVATQRITANTTLYHKDCFITCANTSTISVYLPSSPEKGKVIYLKTTGSAVTLYGNGKSIRFNSSTLNASIALAGDYWMYMCVYDGVYWEVCRYKS